jgi:ABC-type Fe3+-hydroxamate transport system substrate-binding protein
LPIFTDQIGARVDVPDSPKRIISTVPSQTELLFDLGLEDRVVGITKFCIHPSHWRRQKTIIGGTKNLNLERIKALEPDLIIANKEENTRDQIETLKEAYPTWISDIKTIEEASQMIMSVGQMTQTTGRATTLIDNIDQACRRADTKPKGSALYLIWRRPWMGVGKDTFIHEMMKRNGYENALGSKERYPILSDEAISMLSPNHILLSSEPFPFKSIHIQELRSLSPTSSIYMVDGEMFSWYGSRIIKAFEYFKPLNTDGN